MTLGVQSLSRVSVTVSDLGKLTRFYCQALGFSCLDESPVPAPELKMLRLDGPAQRARLRLGEQVVELLCPASPGQVYPAHSRATDAWFQHIAIVVNDMDAAYAQVSGHAITPISLGGPQLLPPSTGRVRAFKFRDPDGHPLELIEFPAGSGDPRWQQVPTSSIFLGFDHSAIVVQDAARSLAFYESLGFSVASRTLNHGPEQERLDGVPDVVADVIALRPAAATPHVELLAYRHPPVSPLPRPLAANDVASARVILTISANAEDAMKDARSGHSTRPTLHHDPDGHAFVLERTESWIVCDKANRARATPA